MRVLHINLSKAGLGRYGLLYGKALDQCTGIEALSVFDAPLLHSAFLRDYAGDVNYTTVSWSGNRSKKGRALRKLWMLAATFRPDIIHDTTGTPARNVVIWPILLRWAPLVVTEHDPDPHLGIRPKPGTRLAKEWMKHAAAHVFVHGPRCRRQLLDRGWPQEKVSVIRHGHLGLFDRPQYTHIPRREHDILFFGELRYNKGIDWLPAIAERVVERHPDATFIVAGSAKTAPAPNGTNGLPRLLEAMKRQPYFEVHDRFIPDDEVAYFFRRAGITVMPYREATQSGIAMIAMPLGSTLVATNVGDLPDVVRHDQTGFITEPGVDDVTALLVELLADPARTRRVRAAAERFARRECDWGTIVQQAVGTYEQVVHARRARPRLVSFMSNRIRSLT